VEQSAYVTATANEDVYITTIPKHKEKVFIQLTADADLDTYLIAADGTVLVWFDDYSGWVGGCEVRILILCHI
jgi:hypothetical protein